MSKRTWCLGMLLLGCAVVPAMADDLAGTLRKVRDAGVITLGYRESSVPFSYLDGDQKPVGYAIDLCGKIVEAVRLELHAPNLRVALNPVTPSTRIPLMANGAIDLECGSTSNSLDREKQVGFSLTDFVASTRFVSKAADNLKTLGDLRGKTVVTTSGTTTVRLINDLNAKDDLHLRIILAKEHADAFLMVATGRASAFVMDDVLLASLVATSRSPDDYALSADTYSVEPYAIMLRRDDPAFKAVVDRALAELFRSGEIDAIYAKWFTRPIPPSSTDLKLPMGAAFRKVVAHPTDSGDPARY